MVTVLRPEALRNATGPNIAGMVDGIENMCAQYIAQWNTLPKYCYLNTSFWAEVMFDLLPTLDTWKLTAVPCEIPYDRVSLHHDYVPKSDIERYHRMSVEEGMESGRLEIV
jgi:hypothetical protein